MTALTIVLPWPDSGLSPNARKHWAAKGKVTRTARLEAYYLTRAAMGKATDWKPSDIPVVETVLSPPDNRRRDLDNMIAAGKAARDGIADAIGVDDSLWQLRFRRGEAVRGGKVTITISGKDAA